MKQKSPSGTTARWGNLVLGEDLEAQYNYDIEKIQKEKRLKNIGPDVR